MIRVHGWLLVGVIEGLLLVRLVALLFAARPDNPALALLLTLTAPLIAPFAILDRVANQPQFGARLELATLAALLVVFAIALVLNIFVQCHGDQQQELEHASSEGFDR